MGIIPLFFSMVLVVWHYCAYKLLHTNEKGADDVKAVNNSPSTSMAANSFASSDDLVVPVHFIDQAAIIRTSIINYTFLYNDILDPETLHKGLQHLIQKPGWNKIGGRLRVNKQGKYEIHVPRHFNSSRPAVHFSHVDCSDALIDTDPLASQVPRPTGSTPSVHYVSQQLWKLERPSALPNNIKHYLATDQPLLCLHVTSFADATLVGLTFPHVLCDAMGASELLKAWCDVVTGKSHLVKPLSGICEDPLATVGTADDKEAKEGEFVLESFQTRGCALVLFISRYLWDVTTRWTIQERHIYLPAEFMTKLRHDVEQELVQSHSGQTPFLSDGDLITAWGSRMVMSGSAYKNCTGVVCNVFDLRARLLQVFNRGNVYLQNTILPATTVFSRGETASASVGQIALRLRQAIVEQTGDVQARRQMRLAREWFASMGTMPLFAKWDSRIIACTNWTKAKFLDAANFGPTAVLGPRCKQGSDTGDSSSSLGKDEGQLGKPVMYWGGTLSVTDKPRDVFVIYGKDAIGNYWVKAYLRPDTWKRIDNELSKFRS